MDYTKKTNMSLVSFHKVDVFGFVLKQDFDKNITSTN